MLATLAQQMGREAVHSGLKAWQVWCVWVGVGGVQGALPRSSRRSSVIRSDGVHSGHPHSHLECAIPSSAGLLHAQAAVARSAGGGGVPHEEAACTGLPHLLALACNEVTALQLLPFFLLDCRGGWCFERCRYLLP